MKKLFILFTFTFLLFTSYSQGVGIGTTTPNNTAQLDISSTTKGLLIPRMTTLQRFAIPSPSNGLMVYDTDKNEFYHYNGTGWRAILNGDYWSRPVTSRDRIANTTDSVGIGTSSPAEWLDVDGNIRSRNNLIADNNVSATGNIIGGNLVTTGNIAASGVSFLSGDVTTNSDLIINNTTATMQLKSSSVNKGFFQLSGDNVRMGTNSGNSTGDLIIRMNGNDRIIINPQGDIDLDGKITRSVATGNTNMLPLCFGFVRSDGIIQSGSGNFTVTKDTEYPGQYTITCTGITINAVLLSSVPYQTATSSPFYDEPNKISIRTWSTVNGAREDHAFYFLVYGVL